VVRAGAWIALLAAGAFAVVLALAFAFQRRLLYFPDRFGEEAALARARRLGLEPWRGRDGSLVGWRAPAAGRPRARVLVFHGNAGSALDRVPYAAALAPRGLEVSLLEYPGYGARAGVPSEGTLSAAAIEAVDALAAEGPEPVLLLGESLGSGVAARAARLRPKAVRGVLLVTPFARLTEVARHHYPFLPGFVLRDRWAPVDDLPRFPGRVAVVLAGRDEVVTAEQGRRLFAALPGTKRLWEDPAATHNTVDLRPGSPLWDEVLAFLAGAAR
jgi:pimeloyl-ACP methyl ester carboxylesterase